MLFRNTILPFFTFILLASCGQNTHSYYNKHREPTNIKIDTFDLMQNSMQLRIEYRSYKEKVLTDLQCDIHLHKKSNITFHKNLDLALSAFSTEVLEINAFTISNSKVLFNQKSIDYQLKCFLTFDKGKEMVINQSVLHLVPASKHKYR